MLLPRFPRPATVLAFAALVIALTGSAIAAKKYVITSKKQIAPKVLKQLKGKEGPAGAKGDTGATGATGATGPKGDTGATGTAGTNGTNGTNGTDGPATATQTVAGEITTTSTTEVELDGPTVTVNVPTGGAFVIIGARLDRKNADAANNSQAAVYEGNTRINGLGGLAPGTTYARQNVVLFTILADAGSHTYTMRYVSGSGTLASFRDRTLFVKVLG